MTLKEAIKKWKKLGIVSCTMNFNCGGDSMGDTSFEFFDEKGSVSAPDLEAYFENTIYDRVEFYVNSDGHYQGEAGTVEITLDDDDDFLYAKNSRSEWSERINSVVGIKLTKPMIEFVKNNVANINGSNDDFAINYKRDFILSEADEKLTTELEDLIGTELGYFEPELSEDDGELQDWFTFTTAINNNDEDGDGLAGGLNVTIKGNILQVEISNEYTSFKDGD